MRTLHFVFTAGQIEASPDGETFTRQLEAAGAVVALVLHLEGRRPLMRWYRFQGGRRRARVELACRSLPNPPVPLTLERLRTLYAEKGLELYDARSWEAPGEPSEQTLPKP